MNNVTGHQFHNTSKFTFEKLKGDSNNIAANLTQYIKGFSTKARDILEHFGFEEHIAKLDKADRLFWVVTKFCEVDLHPDVLSNFEMGQIFEELVRRFNEASNEEAGDQLYFDPIVEDAAADTSLQQAAIANTMENFSYVFLKALEGLFIDRMDQDEEITAKYLNEKEFQSTIGQYLCKQVYERIHKEKEKEIAVIEKLKYAII